MKLTETEEALLAEAIEEHEREQLQEAKMMEVLERIVAEVDPSGFPIDSPEYAAITAAHRKHFPNNY